MQPLKLLHCHSVFIILISIFTTSKGFLSQNNKSSCELTDQTCQQRNRISDGRSFSAVRNGKSELQDFKYRTDVTTPPDESKRYQQLFYRTESVSTKGEQNRQKITAHRRSFSERDSISDRRQNTHYRQEVQQIFNLRENQRDVSDRSRERSSRERSPFVSDLRSRDLQLQTIALQRRQNLKNLEEDHHRIERNSASERASSTDRSFQQIRTLDGHLQDENNNNRLAQRTLLEDRYYRQENKQSNRVVDYDSTRSILQQSSGTMQRNGDIRNREEPQNRGFRIQPEIRYTRSCQRSSNDRKIRTFLNQCELNSFSRNQRLVRTTRGLESPRYKRQNSQKLSRNRNKITEEFPKIRRTRATHNVQEADRSTQRLDDTIRDLYSNRNDKVRDSADRSVRRNMLDGETRNRNLDRDSSRNTRVTRNVPDNSRNTMRLNYITDNVVTGTDETRESVDSPINHNNFEIRSRKLDIDSRSIKATRDVQEVSANTRRHFNYDTNRDIVTRTNDETRVSKDRSLVRNKFDKTIFDRDSDTNERIIRKGDIAQRNLQRNIRSPDISNVREKTSVRMVLSERNLSSRRLVQQQNSRNIDRSRMISAQQLTTPDSQLDLKLHDMRSTDRNMRRIESNSNRFEQENIRRHRNIVAGNRNIANTNRKHVRRLVRKSDSQALESNFKAEFPRQTNERVAETSRMVDRRFNLIDIQLQRSGLSTRTADISRNADTSRIGDTRRNIEEVHTVMDNIGRTFERNSKTTQRAARRVNRENGIRYTKTSVDDTNTDRAETSSTTANMNRENNAKDSRRVATLFNRSIERRVRNTRTNRKIDHAISGIPIGITKRNSQANIDINDRRTGTLNRNRNTLSGISFTVRADRRKRDEFSRNDRRTSTAERSTPTTERTEELLRTTYRDSTVNERDPKSATIRFRSTKIIDREVRQNNPEIGRTESSRNMGERNNRIVDRKINSANKIITSMTDRTVAIRTREGKTKVNEINQEDARGRRIVDSRIRMFDADTKSSDRQIRNNVRESKLNRRILEKTEDVENRDTNIRIGTSRQRMMQNKQDLYTSLATTRKSYIRSRLQRRFTHQLISRRSRQETLRYRNSKTRNSPEENHTPNKRILRTEDDRRLVMSNRNGRINLQDEQQRLEVQNELGVAQRRNNLLSSNTQRDNKHIETVSKITAKRETIRNSLRVSADRFRNSQRRFVRDENVRIRELTTQDRDGNLAYGVADRQARNLEAEMIRKREKVADDEKHIIRFIIETSDPTKRIPNDQDEVTGTNIRYLNPRRKINSIRLSTHNQSRKVMKTEDYSSIEYIPDFATKSTLWFNALQVILLTVLIGQMLGNSEENKKHFKFAKLRNIMSFSKSKIF